MKSFNAFLDLLDIAKKCEIKKSRLIFSLPPGLGWEGLTNFISHEESIDSEYYSNQLPFPEVMLQSLKSNSNRVH